MSSRSPFLSSRGRIGRAAFLGRALLALAAFLALYILLTYSLGGDAGLVALLPLSWALFALSARRLHDSGRSAWWLAALALPLLGPLLLFYLLCCRRGVAAENRFGTDPRQPDMDYLVVEAAAIPAAAPGAE